MSVDPKSIVNYYIGRYFKVRTDSFEIIAQLTVLTDNGFTAMFDAGGNLYEIDLFDESVTLKPILKHLGDISAYDKKAHKDKCKRITDSNGSVIYIADTPSSLSFIMDKGYDAFDLIESGDAIDEAELTINEYNQIKQLQKQTS